MISALTAIPAPSGGAVRLLIHSNIERPKVLILATTAPEAPEPYADIEPRPQHAPDIIMPVRLVYSGELLNTASYHVKHGRHVYIVMDLDSDALPDGQDVHYHLFEEGSGGIYGPPLSISIVPSCARSAAALIARQLVMRRLRYHIGRALADGTLPYDNIPILEQEVREEGEDIPAILVKETATPNPNAETVGHQGERIQHPDGSQTAVTRFAYNVRVDILGLTDNPSDRLTLEKFFKAVFVQDIDYYQHAGVEGPTFSFFPNHTIGMEGTDEYTVETTFEGTVYTRVFEERAPTRDHTTRR